LRRTLLLLALAVTVLSAVTASAALLMVDADDLTVFTYPVDIELPLIPATLDIDPDTLNPESQGNFVTAYVELPELWDVVDIDVSTVKLAVEGEAAAVSAESHPTEVGDYDNDSIPDRMVKFDRAAVIALVADVAAPSTVTFTVSGIVDPPGRTFAGSDTVRLVDPEPESSPTPSPSPTATPTPSPTPTATATPTVTATATPTATPTASAEPTATETPEPAPTEEPDATATVEPTPTTPSEPSSTAEPGATATPSEADTPVPEAKATATATPATESTVTSDADR